MGPRLALFDLDHTLIPFDSGMAWTRFLIEQGHRPAQAEAEYLGYARQYVAGTLDIHAMHRACVTPLLSVPAEQLGQWQAAFAQQVAPRVSAVMAQQVAQHRAQGDLCAIVTATTRCIVGALPALWGIEHVLATEAVPGGADIAGLPCFRAHKIDHVERWLRRLGLPPLAQAERSHFYSDSISDLPLLQAVSDPVVVCPDPRLRVHAQAQRWPLIEAY